MNESCSDIKEGCAIFTHDFLFFLGGLCELFPEVEFNLRAKIFSDDLSISWARDTVPESSMHLSPPTFFHGHPFLGAKTN